MNIFLSLRPLGENYANPKTCFFHVLFKAAGLAMYILSALFFDSFVIIFVVMVLLAALDFWVVKNVSGRILVGLRWWNEINEAGWECLEVWMPRPTVIGSHEQEGFLAILVDITLMWVQIGWLLRIILTVLMVLVHWFSYNVSSSIMLLFWWTLYQSLRIMWVQALCSDFIHLSEV